MPVRLCAVLFRATNKAIDQPTTNSHSLALCNTPCPCGCGSVVLDRVAADDGDDDGLLFRLLPSNVFFSLRLLSRNIHKPNIAQPPSFGEVGNLAKETLH